MVFRDEFIGGKKVKHFFIKNNSFKILPQTGSKETER